MILKSYKKNIALKNREVVICYNLISENDDYHVECRIDGEENRTKSTYAIITNFTKDKEKGIEFVEKLALNEVFPIHLTEIYEDLYE